jgi:hypothetical protein
MPSWLRPASGQLGVNIRQIKKRLEATDFFLLDARGKAETNNVGSP